MTHLVGAWSARGTDPDRLIPAAARAAIRACLPDGAFEEVARPGLWALGAPGRIERGPRTCGAEGLVLGDDAARVESRRGAERTLPPDGHYVRFVADTAPARLVLTRGLSGGERLYYLEHEGVVLFAASLRLLLAHPGVERRLALRRLPEAALTGLVLFGREPLIAGLEEVRPGHAVTWSDGERRDRWGWPGLLEPREGDLSTLAVAFRDALTDAVAAAAGPRRPVAVSLSGGIDSAAIAAAAVEAFGADNVAAFTYEFDDPEHPCETPYAVAVSRRLGIRRHTVFKVGLGEFLSAIPETVWRAESFVHWPKAFMLPVARTIRDAGFDRCLSGFGVGSHLGFFADLDRCIGGRAAGSTAIGHWRWAFTRAGRWLRHLERVHPGLAPPSLRLLLPTLWLLRAHGRIGQADRYFPESGRALLGHVPFDPASLEGYTDLPLGEALSRFSFDRLFSCVDVTRWEKPLREIGLQRVSPAHFAATIPYAYLPPRPLPRLWSRERALRPGKLLLRVAFADRLPESVLFRRKSWADAVVSPRWLAAGVRWMRNASAGDDPLAALGPEFVAAANRWDRHAPQAAVTALRFWARLFVERGPGRAPPTWPALAG